jgi:uncharacterized membrane protein
MSDLQNSPEPVHSEDKVMLVLSYLGLFALIPFFITKNENEYVKWHAKQGLTLFIVSVVALIALMVLAAVLALIHPVLVIVVSLLYLVFGVGMLVLFILAIIKAFNGIRWPIPFVADLSAKLFK